MTDKKLIKVCRDFRKGLLNGGSPSRMCFAVCWPLAGFLAAFDVKCEVEEVDLGETNHVFLRLADGRVLDPTADQFEAFLDIYLGPAQWIHGEGKQPGVAIPEVTE